MQDWTAGDSSKVETVSEGQPIAYAPCYAVLPLQSHSPQSVSVSGMSSIACQVRDTWTPKVCQVIAQNLEQRAQQAIILHTFGSRESAQV